MTPGGPPLQKACLRFGMACKTSKAGGTGHRTRLTRRAKLRPASDDIKRPGPRRVLRGCLALLMLQLSTCRIKVPRTAASGR